MFEMKCDAENSAQVEVIKYFDIVPALTGHNTQKDRSDREHGRYELLC